jgi:Concanavalin A-like lectin/glucanases superfamily
MFANPRVLLAFFVMSFSPSSWADAVLPELAPNLVNYYDLEHPVVGNAAQEQDRGLSGTAINLVNGGAAMRVGDGAWTGSTQALQTQQINPTASGNDDWKAGIYNAAGVASLSAFNSVAGITLMGWVKPTGVNPSPNYNAVGLFGLLSGTSEGHGVRALLEVINVSGTQRLVALGRRLDSGSSFTLAATADWKQLLPANEWTHLTATFDFDNGTMALYRNGQPIAAEYTATGDPWGIAGAPEPDLTSPTNPAGIKIGGSFPQDTEERNPFNGRFDDLMFFDKELSPAEVQKQYESFVAVPEPASGFLLIGGALLILGLRRRQ